MAEKYGEIPKKFTKEWWEYFWDYYKLHTIATAVILFLIIVSVVQAVTSIKYDFNLVYATNYILEDEKNNIIKTKIEENISDLDENGEINARVETLLYSDNEEDIQFSSAMYTKLQLSFVTEETMLFIIDKERMDFLLTAGDFVDVFSPVDEWYEEDLTDKKVYKINGVIYGISLEDSEFFKSNQINSDNLYIAVRRNLYEDEKVKENEENAIIVAKELLK